jgi:hypothetical protein
MRSYAQLVEIVKNVLSEELSMTPERSILQKEIFGDWISEDAIVTDISKDRVVLTPLVDCGGKGGCGKCNLCGPNDKKNSLTYNIRDVEQYSAGDQIRVKRFVVNEAIAAVTVFGFPILFAVLAQLFWHLFIPESADSGRAVLMTLFAGLFGVVAVFIVEQIIKAVYPASIE